MSSKDNKAFESDIVRGSLYYPRSDSKPGLGFLPRILTGNEKNNNIPTSIPIDSQDLPEDDEDDERSTWDNPIEFLMSCISMSVGLGNIWRFPGVAVANGGGAFLIPYLIVLTVIGRPLYYLEMCLGQFSKFGQVQVWNACPLFKGIGYGSLVGVISVCSYYCMIIGISIYYFFMSFAKTVPWDKCHPGDLPENINCTEFNRAQLYFDYTVLPRIDNIDDGLGDMHWKLVLCLVASWIIIFLSLVKGVQSSGKVAYFTALFPYAVLLIMLIRGVTLPGAWQGIRLFLEPQWDKLTDAKVWYAALEQCFFSLSTGFGPVIMFSSYNKFKQDIYRDALILSVMDTFTSFVAGITVFAVIGNLMEDDKDLVVQGGPGLAFVLYPQAIAKFGWAPQLFAVLFFLMLIALGIGSATSFAGGVITIICDQFKDFKRWIVTAVVCACGCLLGLMYATEGGLILLDFVEHYGAGFIIYVMAMLECFAISYVYGLNNFCNDIEFMIGRRPGIYWKLCWGFILPVGLVGSLLYYLISEGEFTSGGVPYPKIATICGWLLTGLSVALVPAWGIQAIMTRKSSGVKAKFLESLKPTSRWGPQKSKLRQEWQDFRREKDAEIQNSFWKRFF